MVLYVCFFCFNGTATTEIHTYITLFPYTTLFRSRLGQRGRHRRGRSARAPGPRRRREGRQKGRRFRAADHAPDRESGAATDARSFVARASRHARARSEEHTSELQSLMRISYAVFCLKTKKNE